MSCARSLGWAAGSLGIVIVGSSASWATASGLTVDGSDDEVVAALAIVAAVALGVFALTRRSWLTGVALLAALASVALIGHDLKDPAGPFGGPGPNIHLQWGIWVALAGSIGLALASVGQLVDTSRHAGKALGLQTPVLGSFSDDAVVKDVAKRLGRPGEQGADLLVTLAEQLRAKAAGRLVEELTPVRELDYPRHSIKLVVSSPEIAKRLGSVEKEPFTVEWIERSVRASDVFYDVGANVGAYSLIAAKVTRNRAKVFAFEPAAPSFRDLARNVLLNDCAESVVPLPFALWSKTGLLSLTFRSVSPGASRHRVSGELGPDKPLTETIVGIRLDDLVERFGVPVPTHAKIDVDGYELEVLRGARRTLARPEWRSIIVELDPEETPRNRAVKTLLADAGFDRGLRHARLPSRRYPHPEERPDVYWTFTRRPRQPGSRSLRSWTRASTPATP